MPAPYPARGTTPWDIALKEYIDSLAGTGGGGQGAVTEDPNDPGMFIILGGLVEDPDDPGTYLNGSGG